MTERHPELASEQAHIDQAYRRLDETRNEALRLKDMVEVGRGGTNQARWEREVINENISTRLKGLHLGERSLCFGRIDQGEDAGGGSYHIGRIAVADSNQEPLIVDWRAPIAEAFYRATGRDPHGLVRRRHFISRGRSLLGLEDEFFGDALGAESVVVNGKQLRGEGALIHALEENRTGRLNDIVGTIQGEQDEIIRAALPGVLVVQGGPGTGKTVVALHRAAFLLYSHRFPLEGQGVLVVGPNRLFLGYIEQVLPSLGEAGAQLAVLADLVGGVRVQGRDSQAAARIKGDLKMVSFLKRALRDRQRPLRQDLVVGFGVRKLHLRAAETQIIVEQARRRYRTHNGARKYVEASVFEALAATHPDGADPEVVKEQLGGAYEIREALDWIWPLLTPGQLLHDLFGSETLIASAGRNLDDQEEAALVRAWEPSGDVSRRVWTVDDVPVLDEAREMLGARPGKRADDLVRTFGHIVVDEAQDLSPMQLRMLTRRSLNGSMTIVGDIAQSTGAWAHNSWQEVLDHLPERHEPRRSELTVGYRIPGPTMELGAAILKVAAPDLKPPVAVRSDGEKPKFVSVPEPGEVVNEVVAQAVSEADFDGTGNIAVVCPQSIFEPVVEAFANAGVAVGRAPQDGLEKQITIVPINLVKGLEVDATIVVEPSKIFSEEPQGARSLYVACTRATKRVTLVHNLDLPDII